jgi:hypothetical protein
VSLTSFPAYKLITFCNCRLAAAGVPAFSVALLLLLIFIYSSPSAVGILADVATVF